MTYSSDTAITYCPHCGAPRSVPVVWDGTIPGAITLSCGCWIPPDALDATRAEVETVWRDGADVTAGWQVPPLVVWFP